MAPGTPGVDITDGRPHDAITFGGLCVVDVFDRPNVTDGLGREFGVRDLFTYPPRGLEATFAARIPHVVRMGPQKKMFRVTALGDIAVMTDAKTVGDFAVEQNPSYARCALAAFAKSIHTPSMRVEGAIPMPACVRLDIDIGHEELAPFGV